MKPEDANFEIQPPSDHPGVKLPPPFTAAFWLLAGLYLNEKLGLNMPGLALLCDIVAIVLIALAMAIVLWAYFTFKKHKTTILPHKPNTNLMTGGIFRFSRNPIYVAFILAQLGIALGLDAPLALLAAPLTLAILYFTVVKKEEAYLTRRFGQDYVDYKLTTRRWI